MNGRTLTLGLVAGLAVAGLARKSSASLNLRGARNGEALRSDLLPAALRDTHDLVVTEIQKRTSHWEPTGVGNGVTSVPYTYHTLVAVLYPKGERQKESRLGQVAATSERKRETPIPLRGRCADDLVRLGGPAYAFGVTGAFVDEGLRGKGVGQALYAALVEAAGTHGGALASNRCLTGTELTSADALRVWERLGRRYAVEGEVAWHRKGSAARGASGSRSTDIEVNLPASVLFNGGRGGWEYDLEGFANWPDFFRKPKAEQVAWAKQHVGAGIREPVDITVFVDGGVGFHDGHHRVLAGSLLGIEIPMRVRFRNFDASLWPDLYAVLKAGYAQRQYNPQGWKLNGSGVPPLEVVRRGPDAADEWIMERLG